MKSALLKPTSMFALVLAGSAAMVLNPAKAHAVGFLPPIDIYVESVTLNAPTSAPITGYLDVYVTVPFDLTVTRFAADLSLDSTAGVSLIGADVTSLTHTVVMPSTNFSDTIVSPSEVSVSNSSEETTLSTNMDLFRVEYQVEPGASGVYTLTLNALMTGVGDNPLSYPVFLHPGTITVLSNSNSPVPEPASLGLLAVGSASLLLRRRFSK